LIHQSQLRIHGWLATKNWLSTLQPRVLWLPKIRLYYIRDTG
jgi:hypothetical protein